MALLVGSARIDENGRLIGGSSGDQTKKEVSTQAYYKHSKGWYVLRPKSVAVANKIAGAMLEACNNQNIGYDQGNRLGVITQLKKYGSLKKIAIKTESDCSSLVRACCIQGGFDPGNFTTGNEASALEKSGYFESRKTVASNTALYNGDVLVTRTKGHTVVVVSGNPRGTTTGTVKPVGKVDPAKSFSKSLAKSYKTTADLHLRAGAGKTKKSLVIIPKGKEVTCYGYYTTSNGVKWLLVKYGEFTGFCSSAYLA